MRSNTVRNRHASVDTVADDASLPTPTSVDTLPVAPKTAIDPAAEIDVVVGVLSVLGRCFVEETRGNRAIRWRRLGLMLLLLCLLGVLFVHPADLHLTGHRSKGLVFDAQKMIAYFGRFRPELPISGVISTHHRSGTVLFLAVGERWCSSFFMDNERVRNPYPLSDPAQAKTVEYQHYYGATEKLVMGMHGFEETCLSPGMVADHCDFFDQECWLTTCNITTPPKNKEAPIVHVVRNPVEVLISAYLYHQQEEPVPEEWLREPRPDALELLPEHVQQQMQSVPYYQVLQQLPPELGLRVEYTVAKEDLFRMARNYRDLADLEYGMNIKYEDVTSDFRSTMEQVVTHLEFDKRFKKEDVLERAMIYDIKNMKSVIRINYGIDMHVTEGKHDKATLRQVLYADKQMRGVFEAMAEVLAYSNPFSINVS